MSIRHQFYIIIFLTILISLLINNSSYKNNQKLEEITDATTLLGKRVTTLTSFRATSRQSLLELTEYLYTRNSLNKFEYEKLATHSTLLIKNLTFMTLESKDDVAPIVELQKLHSEYLKKVKKLLFYTSKPFSKDETDEREKISIFFQMIFLPKVGAHLKSINDRLEFELNLYRSVSRNMAVMTMKLTGALSIFVILVFVFMTHSIVKRLNQLNQTISEFDLFGTTVTNGEYSAQKSGTHTFPACK